MNLIEWILIGIGFLILSFAAACLFGKAAALMGSREEVDCELQDPEIRSLREKGLL